MRPLHRITLLIASLAALLLASAALSAAPPDSAAKSVGAASGVRPTKDDLIQPEDLAEALSLPEAKRPLLVHVGFPTLYRSAHIAGSKYAGPCAKPEGRDSLTALLKTVKKDRAIVLYCGCCPWKFCPNVQPAYAALKKLGFKRVKVLHIATGFGQEWSGAGYPAVPGS